MSRPPIIPIWLRSWTQFKQITTETAARWAYIFMYRFVRIPLYLVRLWIQAPWGLARAYRAHRAWLTVERDLELIADIRSTASDAKGNVTTTNNKRDDKVRIHAKIDAIVLLIGIGIGVAGHFYLIPDGYHRTFYAAVAVVTVTALGAAGRSEDDPDIVEPVVFAAGVRPKIDQDLVMQALRDSQIPRIGEAFKEGTDHVVQWVTPVTRTDNGIEWVIDMPLGVTVEQVAAHTANIAGTLKRPESTVWVSAVPDDQGGHAGRVHVLVLNKPLRDMPVAPWPLLDAVDGVDVFDPQPFGIDHRGDPVTIDLMFAAGTIGAIPRMGKTYTMRLLFLIAALDPRAEIHIFDLKGGPDWRSFRQRAATFFNGKDHKAMGEALNACLDDRLDDMARRYRVFNELADAGDIRAYDGQVTSELASDPNLGLHPVFFGIDETQICFAYGPYRETIRAKVERLTKEGPAVGYNVWLASQEVTEDTIPRSISTMAALRLCLKVSDHVATNLILGGSATREGHHAHKLTKADKGVAFFAGEAEGTRQIRMPLVDGHAAQRVIDMAMALQGGHAKGHATTAGGHGHANDSETRHASEPRQHATTTAGMATTPVDVVVAMAMVWPCDRRGDAGYCHLADIVPLLAREWPELYGDLSVKSLGSTARDLGVPIRQRGNSKRVAADWADVFPRLLERATR